MTRKDYIRLAAAIARTADNDKASVARAIAVALADETPRFDRARFLSACGVEPTGVASGPRGKLTKPQVDAIREAYERNHDASSALDGARTGYGRDDS